MCFLKIESRHKKHDEVMSKISNIVHSGWMTKSPPEPKLQSPLKIFRAKWKQRFFILNKPQGSLPDHYELSYYNSEQSSKKKGSKKGSIDLDQCEQIIESLGSDRYPYLFAIKTFCKGKERTYYLSTKSEDDMTTWVECLCRVCGLKQEDTPTDIPDTIQPQYNGSNNPAPTIAPRATNNAAGDFTLAPTPSVTSQPKQSPPLRKDTIPSSSTSQLPPSTSPQSYFLLKECTTGTSEKHGDRYMRTDSVDSVPEYPAPPPPAKKGSNSYNNNNNNELPPKGSSHEIDVYDRPPVGGGENYDRPRSGFQEVYDRPRSSELKTPDQLDGSDFYKHHPTGHSDLLKVSNSGALDLNAAVPLPIPRRSPHSARSSISSRPDSGESLTECYDVPPGSHHDRPPMETYDVPPPGFSDRPMTEMYDTPPADRPPVEIYDTPPSADFNSQPMSENYDFPPPRASASSQDSLDFAPPPPQRPPKPHGLKVQSGYQNVPNTPTGHDSNDLNAVPTAPSTFCAATLSYDVPRASQVVPHPRDSSVLDISPVPPRPTPRHGSTSGQSYVNAPPLPPLPNLSLHKTSDSDYSNVGGGGGRESQDLYQVPPVVPVRSNPVPAARGAASSPAEEETHIWSSTRTKSFKRHHQISLNPNSAPARPPRPPLPVPNPSDVASSSDDDDDLSIDGNDIQTHVDPGNFRMSTTVPLPSERDLEPELKYLDLDLDPGDIPRSPAAASHSKSTEYREIDFIKTQALQDTKRARHLEK